MRLVNLTPHPIHVSVRDSRGLPMIRTISPEFPPARVEQFSMRAGEVEGIPIVRTRFGGVQNLPEPDGETLYIVSMPVLNACPDRTDLVRPDTGPSSLRDSDGRIIAVRRFTR